MEIASGEGGAVADMGEAVADVGMQEQRTAVVQEGSAAESAAGGVKEREHGGGGGWKKGEIGVEGGRAPAGPSPA